MPKSNSTMIYNLQRALNSRDMKILCNRTQFYSREQNRPVTIYKINQSQLDTTTGKTKHKELFSSASQIQVVLFLRNLWYLINKKDVPSSNSEDFEAKWMAYLDSIEVEELEDEM